jgi:hypothetical protein
MIWIIWILHCPHLCNVRCLRTATSIIWSSVPSSGWGCPKASVAAGRSNSFPCFSWSADLFVSVFSPYRDLGACGTLSTMISCWTLWRAFSDASGSFSWTRQRLSTMSTHGDGQLPLARKPIWYIPCAAVGWNWMLVFVASQCFSNIPESQPICKVVDHSMRCDRWPVDPVLQPRLPSNHTGWAAKTPEDKPEEVLRRFQERLCNLTVRRFKVK